MYNMYTTCIFGAWSWRSQGQWYCILLCSLARDPAGLGGHLDSDQHLEPLRFSDLAGAEAFPLQGCGMLWCCGFAMVCPWYWYRKNLLVGRSTSKFISGGKKHSRWSHLSLLDPGLLLPYIQPSSRPQMIAKRACKLTQSHTHLYTTHYTFIHFRLEMKESRTTSQKFRLASTRLWEVCLEVPLACPQ